METFFQRQKNENIVIRIVFWVAFILIAIFALIPSLSGSGLNLPYKFFAVESGSMRPVIKEGDLIAVKTQNSEYNTGDIITFRFKDANSKANNTHRIVEVRTTRNGDNEYVTKGDSNSVIDVDTVTEDRIVGKYIFRIPLLGYPIRFVQTVPGLILLIVVPSIILIYEEINSIKKEIKKRRYYKSKYFRRNNTYQK